MGWTRSCLSSRVARISGAVQHETAMGLASFSTQRLRVPTFPRHLTVRARFHLFWPSRSFQSVCRFTEACLCA